jgi:hypothetical protein
MLGMYKFLMGTAILLLFIIGLAAMVMAFVRIIGSAGGGEVPELATMTAYFGYGMGGLFLSAVLMVLRKKLED